MQRAIKLFIFTIMVLSIQAQDCDGYNQRTLFGDRSGFGGYLGINTRFTELNGQDALLIGGETNFILNHAFNVGVEGYGLVNRISTQEFTDDGKELFLQMGYGGLHLEPVLYSEHLVHLTFPVLLGAGGVGQATRPLYQEQDGEIDIEFDQEYHDSDLFFVAEPGVMMELNLFRFMRLAGGASYRFTTDVDLGAMDAEDIQGWNATVSLRIGWF